jgi:hypothetical protein
MGLVMLVQVKLEILRTLADYTAHPQGSGSQPFLACGTTKPKFLFCGTLKSSTTGVLNLLALSFPQIRIVSLCVPPNQDCTSLRTPKSKILPQ